MTNTITVVVSRENGEDVLRKSVDIGSDEDFSLAFDVSGGEVEVGGYGLQSYGYSGYGGVSN